MSVALCNAASSLAAGALRTLSSRVPLNPVRLERFGQLAADCIGILLQAAKSNSFNSPAGVKELAAAVTEARQLSDQAPLLRKLQVSPVACGDVIKPSACEAAIEVAAQVVEAGTLAAFTDRDLRYLLAQLLQEVAKATDLGPRDMPAADQAAVLEEDRVPPQGRDEDRYVFRFDGVFWQVRFGAESALRPFKNLEGMHYIHRMLACRYETLAALDLYRLHKPAQTNQRSVLKREYATHLPGNAQALASLDPSALANYRSRLSELQNQIDDAQELGNEPLQEKLQREQLAILKQLGKDQRLGGRSRRLDTSPGEEARQAVQKAVARAYAMLEEAGMTELVAHLRNTIDTKTDCLYCPEADFPSWSL